MSANPEPTWWNGDDDRDEPFVVCDCGAHVAEDEAHWHGREAFCDDCYFADPDVVRGLAAELDADEKWGK